MPFLTEELWHRLPGVSNELHAGAYKNAEASIMLTSYPTGDDKLIDAEAESAMQAVIDLITKIRNIRAEMSIPSSNLFHVHIAANEKTREIFAANEAQILKLAKSEKLVMGDKLDAPKASAKAVTNNAEIAIPLEGLIDFDKERTRLGGQIEKLDTELQRLNGQLSNKNFVEKAPAEKVSELRERQTEIEQQIATLSANLDALN